MGPLCQVTAPLYTRFGSSCRPRLSHFHHWRLRLCPTSASSRRICLRFAAANPRLILGVRRQQIGRAHVCTPVTNAHLVCRLLLEIKKTYNNYTLIYTHTTSLLHL